MYPVEVVIGYSAFIVIVICAFSLPIMAESNGIMSMDGCNGMTVSFET